MRTNLHDKLSIASFRPSGFDYMRFILASLVICQHSINITQGQPAAVALFQSPIRPVILIILPMFFALSGFLVAGSLYRCRTLISFAGLRILRLTPALFAEVVLSALILGPIFTSLSIQNYVSDIGFRSYFLNVFGIIHTTLPGIFLNNPLPLVVNGQLWTIPYELECYIVLVVIAGLGLVWRPKLFLVSLAGMQIGIAIYAIRYADGLPTLIPGRLLVVCFLFGVSAYQMRKHIWHSHTLAFLSLGAWLWCAFNPIGTYLVAIPVVYLTVYFGSLNPKRSKLLLSGDYSYGMYLYGFPVQQFVVAIWPGHTMHWFINIVASLVLTFLVAHFSWFCIEKPMLNFKQKLKRFEDLLMNVSPSAVTSILRFDRSGRQLE